MTEEAPPPPPIHHFTVDVEEVFHALAMRPSFPVDGWEDEPRRSPAVVDRVLELLEETGSSGTFFVVAWLADREPGMVRAIAAAGHEVASHGDLHEAVTSLDPASFGEVLRRSKGVLEDLTGREVLGYRAPSFSIVPDTDWALDVLLEEGYRYDSSVFPVSGHPDYGWPGSPPDPHRVERDGGVIVEVPPTTVEIPGGTRLPAAGGAYFRFFPPTLVKAGLRQAEARGAPGTFYIHPWELDDYVPPVSMSRTARVRTFLGRRRTWPRLKALLDEFSFGPIAATVKEMEGQR